MPKDHHETTITIDHDAQAAHIWTSERRICKKLLQLGAIVASQTASGAFLTLPATSIRFRKAVKLQRPRTEAQRLALTTARMAKARKLAENCGGD